MLFDIYLFAKLKCINKVIYKIKSIYVDFSIEKKNRAINLKEKMIVVIEVYLFISTKNVFLNVIEIVF